LKKTKRKGGMPKFPSGKMFGADKEDFVKKRKQKLQTYISEILKIPEVMKTGLLTGNILKHTTHTPHTNDLLSDACRLPEDERPGRHVPRVPERGRRFDTNNIIISNNCYSVTRSTRAYAWSHQLSQL
jgi:hypothetical protein